jgi:hypothetical protein
MRNILRYQILVGCLLASGCNLLPDIAHQPTLHNPFPQLSKVAVAPFFNQSSESTADGRRVALAYYNELQLVPGFEVTPIEVTEQAIRSSHNQLASPADARLLAQMLGVDAIVIGAITDYTPYYPPRLGMKVEWYAANPNFHPIPPGYGLPWGTPEERDIPAPLVFEAEFALAKAQLATQTPPYQKAPGDRPPDNPANNLPDKPAATHGSAQVAGGPSAALPGPIVQPSSGQPPVACLPPGPGLPPDWPDARGLIPPPPSCRPPLGRPVDSPVLSHTRTYNAHDMDFTESLASYYFFRDDARMGGWQAYLQRSDDFIRFCCHRHISEMLSARGGAGETRVVWRWPTIR